MVKEVTDQTFKAEVLDENSLPILLDFWAPWCGPCCMVSPIVEQMGQAFAGKLKVCKINTDENQQTATNYGITGIPSLLVFKDGQEIQRMVGYRPANVLEADLQKVIEA